MTDEPAPKGPAPDPSRPLQGMTVLVVEDSRFASEAVRLLCLRSGARIRRADSLAAAARHLRVYRPNAVIIDVGLPDGSGVMLIRDLCHASGKPPAVVAMSGDDSLRGDAIAAGAAGFLAKPVESLGLFQQVLLGALAGETMAPRLLPGGTVTPDPVALRDDLSHAAEVIGAGPDGRTLDYLAQFLTGLARSARDGPLEAAAVKLAHAREAGSGAGEDLAALAGMLRQRIDAAGAL